MAELKSILVIELSLMAVLAGLVAVRYLAPLAFQKRLANFYYRIIPH
jgi:hypothetical protein